MKRVVALMTVIFLFTLIFSGCMAQNVFDDYYISLAQQPTEFEEIFTFNDGSDSVRLNFTLPESGYIKLLVNDYTEYEKEPDKEPEFFVDYKTADGTILYENVSVSYGYTEKLFFDEDTVIAEITAKNQSRHMQDIAVSWAFANDEQAVQLKLDTLSAAVVDDVGCAQFFFRAEKDGVYEFKPTEACVSECDCYFTVINSNGESVTEELMIHSTEWISRLVFLKKGDYSVKVSSVSAVVCCEVNLKQEFANVDVNGEQNGTLPATVGFDKLHQDSRTFTFNADGITGISIEASGSGTYYDSMQTAEYIIRDDLGQPVLQDSVEESGTIDVADLNGICTLELFSTGSCVIEIKTGD